MISYLDRISVNKQDLVGEIEKILQKHDFCGKVFLRLERIENLLSSLREDISFVIEYPYIDRHYRDTYYSFHASKFNRIGRNCIRIHIFTGELLKDKHFLEKDSPLPEKYLGFFIIRPLPIVPLGRSLISPEAFPSHNFVCCLMKSKVSLFGHKLEVHGFPHIAQDMETHTCAESSLWSFVEYFGSKYPQYKPLVPSQIIQNLLQVSEHRLLPSKGLTKKELAQCLHDNGFQCLTYSIGARNSKDKESKTKELFSLLRIYIESGIPLLLVLENDTDGHALLAIGHELDTSPYPIPTDKPWVDVSSFNRKIVFIDDNVPPYQVADLSKPGGYYQDEPLKNLKIVSFIVPFPAHVFLAAETVYALIEQIFEDPKIRLAQFGKKWITRIFLTGSPSFKQYLLENDTDLNDTYKTYMLRLNLPKFIWICEIYNENARSFGKYCSGLLIIDTTSESKSYSSVLLYALEDKILEFKGNGWFINTTKVAKFKMTTYQNNLKGDWNKWTS